MGERQEGGEHTVGNIEVVVHRGNHHGLDVGHHLLVREHHRLGQAGGARGVHDHGHVIGRGQIEIPVAGGNRRPAGRFNLVERLDCHALACWLHLVQIDRWLRIEPGHSVGVLLLRSGNVDDRLHVWQLVCISQQSILQLLGGDDVLGLGLTHAVAHASFAQVREECHHDAAQLGHRQARVEPAGLCLRVDDHLVALLDAERLEALGQVVDLVEHLARAEPLVMIGQHHLLQHLAIDQHRIA